MSTLPNPRALTGNETREEQLAIFADLFFQAAVQVRTLRQISIGNHARLEFATEAWENSMSLCDQHALVDRWFQDQCAMLAAAFGSQNKASDNKNAGLH